METMTRTTAHIRAITRHWPGEGGPARPVGEGPRSRSRILRAVIAAGCLGMAGCVSDQELLRDSRRSAQEFVREHAVRDLGCPAIQTGVTAGKEEPGQPLGDLLSEFQVTARGCGTSRRYDVFCDGHLCSLKE